MHGCQLWLQIYVRTLVGKVFNVEIDGTSTAAELKVRPAMSPEALWRIVRLHRAACVAVAGQAQTSRGRAAGLPNAHLLALWYGFGIGSLCRLLVRFPGGPTSRVQRRDSRRRRDPQRQSREGRWGPSFARLILHGGRTRVTSAGDVLVVFVSRKPPAAVATVRTALKMPPPFEIPPSLRADASTPAVAEQPSWRTQLQELVLAMSAPSG